MDVCVLAIEITEILHPFHVGHTHALDTYRRIGMIQIAHCSPFFKECDLSAIRTAINDRHLDHGKAFERTDEMAINREARATHEYFFQEVVL